MSENGFCPMNDNQDCRQNRYRFVIACYCTCGHYLNHLLPDCFQISYINYFCRTLAQVRILDLSDNQDGRQDGRHLSVYICGHSNLVIYHPSSSKFQIWITFIKLLFMSEYGSCPMNDNQDCRQNRHPLLIAEHYAGPFVGV